MNREMKALPALAAQGVAPRSIVAEMGTPSLN